jgi:putative ABC transport system permease protein
MPNLILFGLLGLGMLFLAFFNYINLTLAASLDRAKQVGIRKVSGAHKSNIVVQFLTESVLMSFVSFLLATLEFRLISNQPTIQRLIGNIPQDFKLWIYFLFFTLITGIIAGWIPAQLFSNILPVKALRGKFDTKLLGRIALRKTLLVTQFSVSLVALIYAACI